MQKRERTAYVQLKARMHEHLRAKIEDAARVNGVSLNAELVNRLEQSFERQDLLPQVLRLAYDPSWAKLNIELHKNGMLKLSSESIERLVGFVRLKIAEEVKAERGGAK